MAEANPPGGATPPAAAPLTPAWTEDDEISRLQRAQQHAAVAKLSEMAMSENDVESLFDSATELVARTLGAEMAMVYQYQPEDGAIVVRGGSGDAEVLGRVAPSADPDSYAGYAIRAFSPMVVDDMRIDARFSEATSLAREGLVSAVSAVIERAGARWGLISAHDRFVGHFGMDEAHFMQSVSSVLGAAITRMESERELHESRARLELAMAVGGLGTWEWDLETGAISASDGLLEILGIERDAIESIEQYLAMVHEDDRDEVAEAFAQLQAEGGSRKITFRHLKDAGETRWIEARGTVLSDERSPMGRLLGVASDVTERRRIEELREALLKRERQARQASERNEALFAMLAEVGDTLNRTLDYKLALRDLAKIVVPVLGDWCIVDVFDTTGEPEQIVVHVADDENEELAEHVQDHYSPRALPIWVMDEPFGRAPVLYRDVTDETLDAASHDPEHRALLVEMGLRSLMIVPLIARGRVLGRIFLATAESKRRYGPEELKLAQTVAERAAVAVDNARLFAERSTVARTLQRALLPPALPAIEGIDLAARYRPAGDGTIIGGDFYDTFPAGERSWWICIGDVCGKGTEAAAITGLLRHSLRAAAAGQVTPSKVLETVNQAIHEQIPADSFCTAALLRVSVTDAGAEFLMASAGHPVPLVIRTDGSVERIDCQGMLLGPFETIELEDVVVNLAAGDSVVLFTDGVTEARNDQGFFGEGGLRRVLAANPDRDASALADAVEKSVVSFEEGKTSDDIAVVVVRVRPEPDAP